MRITDLLSSESIALHAAASNKKEAIETLVSLQEKNGVLSDREAYQKAIYAREEQGSTAIEAGIAVPHAKSSSVVKPGLAAMTLDTGVDYGAMDHIPSDLFFMIAAPPDGEVHLEILSRLMVLLMDPAFTENLRGAKDSEEFLQVIDRAEAGKYGESVPPRESKDASAETAAREAGEDARAAAASDGGGREISGEHGRNRFRVLAVTACPTGIAHTYMAAEALERAGTAMGFTIKVETDGSGGAKNVLTAKEIEEADGIIVAADKKVEISRFHGKKVLFTKVAAGIHKPEELIRKIIDGDAPVYRHEGGAAQEEETGEGLGRTIYKHLMNGVSHMLPFVIGGGIMIALAFLLDDYSLDPGNFGMNTPVAAFFKTVGGVAFGFMLPILAGYIAYSIADRPGLAVGFVGGSLAAAGNSFANITADQAISGGFLAALLAGFVGGYLVAGLRRLSDRLPKSLESIKPILIYPLFGILLMGVFMCAVNPVMGAINIGITDFLTGMGGASKVLLGCVVGGMMSIDMGGPFNKAAYVFGTASIAAGNFDVMAAVMVGGMVPPLAIAIASTFFKKKFTEEERKSGLVNYIMGLCFISEGAIPFAASDPLRVIPSCVVGSAVSGGLSMLLGCTLRAPHGGIFVFPVVGNVAGYIIALAAGSIAGALILALLKKNIAQQQ